jgi:hypothetical protein
MTFYSWKALRSKHDIRSWHTDILWILEANQTPLLNVYNVILDIEFELTIYDLRTYKEIHSQSLI